MRGDAPTAESNKGPIDVLFAPDVRPLSHHRPHSFDAMSYSGRCPFCERLLPVEREREAFRVAVLGHFMECERLPEELSFAQAARQAGTIIDNARRNAEH